MGPKTRHLPKQTEVKKTKLKDRSWLIATQQKALHVNTYEQQKKLKWISKRLNNKIDTVGGRQHVFAKHSQGKQQKVF